MERINYPFRPGSEGIPFKTVFDNYVHKINDGEIIGGSGANLSYAIERGLLYVEDSVFGDRFMHAYVEDGFAQFNIRTKTSPLDTIRHEFPWPRHPDMFAKKFIGVALEHFKNDGIEIIGCIGVWEPNSDNHAIYTRELAVDGNRLRAAKATASAKMFAAHGFNKITSNEIKHVPFPHESNKYSVIVYFYNNSQ